MFGTENEELRDLTKGEQGDMGQLELPELNTIPFYRTKVGDCMTRAEIVQRTKLGL